MATALQQRLMRLVVGVVFLGGINSAWTQIPVGVTGTPMITFSSNVTLLPTEWATSTNGLGNFSSSSLTTPAQVEAAVQTFDQSAFAMALPTTTSGGSSRYARHNTTAENLYTLPAGIEGVLKATLRNVSGLDIIGMTVSYDFGRPGSSTANFEELPGYRVFFSMTGLPNSWQAIPEFSGVFTGGTVSATLDLGLWPPGTDMYLLWVDDNAITNPDGTNSIDNFTVSDVVHGDPSPLTITSPPQSTNVAERGSVTFTVGVDGSPRKYFWFSNHVQVAGNNQATFTIPSASYEENNGAEIHVVVSNALMVVTSTPAILTVIPDAAPPAIVSVIGELDSTRLTVTFSEALDPSVSEENFLVFATGGDPSGPEALLTTGFLFISNNTSIIITTDPRVPGVNYSLRLSQLFDASSQHNPLIPDPTVVPVRPMIQLIGFDTDNEWKWDLNNGDRFGTGWETVGYDDSAWPSGPAGLGLDASANGVPIRTALPYLADSAPAYFRRHFSLPTGTNGVTLRLRHVIEDGAVYYINGQEAGRFRVGSAPLTFASRASVAAPDPTPMEGPFILPTTNLIPGDNVIAVVVLQSGATSSDVEFAAELTILGRYPEGPPPPPTVQSQTVLEGQSVTFSVQAEGALPIYYQWRKGGVDIPGATNSIYTINPVLPSHAGLYTVFISNSVGSVETAPATLTVIPSDPPVFLSAVAHTNLTNITLTFSDRLNRENAENPEHYRIQSAGDTLNVLSASLINATNVVLVTSPRTPGRLYLITLEGVTDDSVARNAPIPTMRTLRWEVVALAPDDLTFWRYNSASNNLDGTGWRLPDFDDSSWPAARAGFTTSNNLEVTTNGFELRSTNMLAPSVGGPVTTYYRVHFNFPWATTDAALDLVGVVDDGLIAYLNGVEAGRLRMTNANPASFTNLATSAGPESGHTHLPLERIALTNLTGLVSGDNLLAIELHQNSVTSSDAVLCVQLVGVVDPIHVECFPTLSIAHDSAAGQITISHVCLGTLQETTELLGVGTVWSDVPGNPNPYVFSPAASNKRFFRLVP